MTSGQGFRGLEAEIKILRQVVKDPRPTLNQVVYPYLREHIQRQFETSGAHGGGPTWDFSGEPIYARQKTSLLGKNLGSKPLVWEAGDAQLLPSLTNPQHPNAIFRLEPSRLVVGSNLPYAEALLSTGGIGPYGEPFPARDPFRFTPEQQRELGEEILWDLRRRLRHYHKTPTLL